MIRMAWALVLFFATAAQSQYFRWVDDKGNVHYGDRPPPFAAGKVQPMRHGSPAPEKNLPYAVREAIANFPVTLYVSANCGAGCSEGRDYLKMRGIPFSEKKVESNAEIELLRTLSDGEAVVPVMSVGSRIAKGWLKDDWRRLLDAAGYPKEKP